MRYLICTVPLLCEEVTIITLSLLMEKKKNETQRLRTLPEFPQLLSKLARS